MRIRFKTQYQNRRGIGSTHQAEAVREFNAQAVDGDDFGRTFKLGIGSQLFNHFVAVAAFRQVDVEFRSGNTLRQVVQHFGRIVEGRQDFQEACAGIHTVVEAVPAFFKENVTAHFASNQCAGFFHGGFDEAVAGFFHHRFAAVFFNPRRKQTGGFDVENHFGFRIAAQHVLSEKHQLAVWIDDVAVFGDDAQAVGIAIKCQADFGIAVFKLNDEVLQVFRFGRVGVVIREIAVHFAEKFGHFIAQTFVEFACKCAADTVARVNHDFHRTFELDVADDVVVVFAGDVFFGYAALFVGGNKTVFFNNG